MLVDSGYERRTLRLIAEKGAKAEFTIEKPLHDLGVANPGDDRTISPDDEVVLAAEGAPPVIKPDFILRRNGRQPIIVETMGFKFDWYRDRKRNLVPQMLTTVGTQLVAEHDFHRPQGVSQDERDATFGEALDENLIR